MQVQASDEALQRPGNAGVRTLAEQELINSLGWLLRMRWLAGAAVPAGALVAIYFVGLDLPLRPLVFLAASIVAYNAVFVLVLRWLDEHRRHSEAAYQWFARVQIGLDWVATTVLIALSGGIESAALSVFLFHIAVASLLLPHDRAFLYVALAPFLVGLVAWGEYSGVIRHVEVFVPPRHRDPRAVATILLFFTFASYVMAYLAMAISRRLRRRENELSGLYMSARTTGSTLDCKTVLERLTEATAKVLGCRAAAIRLLDPARGRITVVASYGLSQAYKDVVPADLARAPIDRETLSGKTVLVGDVRTDPRVLDVDRVESEGIRSMLSTPLVGKHGPVGVLRAYGSRPDRFTPDDANFLAAVAAQGVVAIENAQAYELLQKLNEEKSRFARIATHELRSPIQVSQNLLAVVVDGYTGQLSAGQADMINRALRRIQQLQSLVDDLLDLASAQATLVASQPRGPVTMNLAVSRAVGRHRAHALSKGLKLSMSLPSAPLLVWGSDGEMDRLLENLLSNAIKYTPAGEVAVSLEQDGSFSVLRVSDTGIGIPADSLPKLFQEFYRAPNAKAIEERGTGLGLSIVREIVERCGGEVSVESREGGGTTFTLRFHLSERVTGAPVVPIP